MNQQLALLMLPARVLCVLLVILFGFSVQLALFWCVSRATQRAIVRLWSAAMLLALGVKCHAIGTGAADTVTHAQANTRHTPAPDRSNNPTALYVCNHVSWLDILALQATAPVVFVAKSEIRRWPILGWMVGLAGTCFIHRERRTALRGVHSVLTAHLQTGQSVCIFPEGTTSDGVKVLPFHAGLLQAAIEAQVAIAPIRLDYSSLAAAYIGDMTLLQSLGNVLLTPALSVTVQTLPRIPSTAYSRQALATSAHTAIARALPPANGRLSPQ